MYNLFFRRLQNSLVTLTVIAAGYKLDGVQNRCQGVQIYVLAL